MNDETLFDFEHAGLRFRCGWVPDDAHAAPWIEYGGLGHVRASEARRGKAAGERLLWDGGARLGALLYSYADAIAAARDVLAKYPPTDGDTRTLGQRAAAEVESEFARWRAYAADAWHYGVLAVTLLDTDGNETDLVEYLGGIESDSGEDYMRERAAGLAETLADIVGASNWLETGAGSAYVQRWRVRYSWEPGTSTQQQPQPQQATP